MISGGTVRGCRECQVAGQGPGLCQFQGGVIHPRRIADKTPGCFAALRLHSTRTRVCEIPRFHGLHA